MRPLYDEVHKIADNAKGRFCMPGHSGHAITAMLNSCRYDLTEIPQLDNLLNPEGVIKEAEELLAKAYNCKHCLMLTTGTTTGMQIAVRTIASIGKTVAYLGELHKSFFNACTLSGCKLRKVQSVEVLDSYLNDHTEVCALFLTSPDYFGNCKDVKRIAKITKAHNCLVVLDAAHGAHFAFSKLLPEDMSSYVDIELISMHKTLPVYGGGALINCNNESLYEKLLFFRQLLHTTSPNYLVLASMDFARDYAENYAESDYAKVKEKIDSFGGRIGGFEIRKSDDFTRLVLRKKGKDCYDVQRQLQEKNILVEMAYFDMLVLIVTPPNVNKLDDLARELKAIKLKPLEIKNYKLKPQKLRDISKTSLKFLALEEAKGHIVATNIGIYPPGQPIVKEREIITDEVYNILDKNRERLYGLVNKKVAVYIKNEE